MSNKESGAAAPASGSSNKGIDSDGKPQPGASREGGQAEAKLLEDINLAMKLPLPGTDDFWQIAQEGVRSGQKGLLKYLKKKKDLTEDELSDLRQEAENAPGRARVKIQMLSKKFSENTNLIMLSALCTYRLVKNTSNRKNMLEGLRAASRESAYALINDGISLYNCESFFQIYFEYLWKLKRFQLATYKTLRESVSHQGSRKKLASSLKICDSLLDEKNRATKVLGQIKGKFKSSSYTVPWGLADIQMAARKVEQSEYKVICGPAEARETLIYSLALTELFARIPILDPLVEAILKLVPENTTSLLLRKHSIQINRTFTQLNIAIQNEDTEKKKTLGRQIYQSASENLARIANQPIKQSHEADFYFFLSRVALQTFGSYEAKEQREMLLKSLHAMTQVTKLDMTKNNVYTASAQTMSSKISALMKE